MRAKKNFLKPAVLLPIAFLWCWQLGDAQEKVKVSYSSVDASNAVWQVAQEEGFYKKYGLDASGIAKCAEDELKKRT